MLHLSTRCLLAATGLLLLTLPGHAQSQPGLPPTELALMGTHLPVPFQGQTRLHSSSPAASPAPAANRNWHNGGISEAWVARYNGPANKFDEARAIALDKANGVYVTGGSANGSSASMSDYTTAKYDRRTGQRLWTARYNGPANGDDQPAAIATDPAGDVYVTGRSSPNSSFAPSDYATVKYDGRTGRQLWVARYNGPANSDDQATAIAVDAAGSVVVTGISFAGTTAFAFYNFATVKYDQRTGRQLWATQYDGPAGFGDFATAIALDASGNAYITGTSATNASEGLFDYATVKYDGRTGQPRWVARYDGPAHLDDTPAAIVTDATGDVVVTGRSTANAATAATDYATVKYDQRTGQPRWVARYNGPADGDDGAVALALDAAKNVYVTGTSQSSGGYEYATLKYDRRTGQPLWTARYDASAGNDNQAADIAVDAAGGVYVTGSTATPGLFNADYATVRYDQHSGQMSWAIRSDGPAGSNDLAATLAVEASGNVYVTGSSYNGSDYDYMTVKYEPSGCADKLASPTDVNISGQALVAYPNPAAAATTLRFQLAAPASAQVEVYNQFGKLVATLKQPVATPDMLQTLALPTGQLPNGVYLCRLAQGRNQVQQLRLQVQH